MKLSRHKSLIREISPGVIQIGSSPYAPTLTLSELAGGMEVSSAKIDNISGDLMDYKDAIFKNKPTVSGRKVLLEGDIADDNLAERVNNTGQLLENSIVDVSGLLQTLIDQETENREDADIILNTAIEQISGLLITEINQIELSITNINNDIINANTSIIEVQADLTNVSGDINTINNNILNTNTDITDLQSDIISISGDVSNISSTTSGISYLDAENLAKKWAIIFG